MIHTDLLDINDLLEIVIGEVTLLFSEFLLITVFGSNIVGAGFIIIAKL